MQRAGKGPPSPVMPWRAGRERHHRRPRWETLLLGSTREPLQLRHVTGEGPGEALWDPDQHKMSGHQKLHHQDRCTILKNLNRCKTPLMNSIRIFRKDRLFPHLRLQGAAGLPGDRRQRTPGRAAPGPTAREPRGSRGQGRQEVTRPGRTFRADRAKQRAAGASSPGCEHTFQSPGPETSNRKVLAGGEPRQKFPSSLSRPWSPRATLDSLQSAPWLSLQPELGLQAARHWGRGDPREAGAPGPAGHAGHRLNAQQTAGDHTGHHSPPQHPWQPAQ